MELDYKSIRDYIARRSPLLQEAQMLEKVLQEKLNKLDGFTGKDLATIPETHRFAVLKGLLKDQHNSALNHHGKVSFAHVRLDKKEGFDLNLYASTPDIDPVLAFFKDIYHLLEGGELWLIGQDSEKAPSRYRPDFNTRETIENNNVKGFEEREEHPFDVSYNPEYTHFFRVQDMSRLEEFCRRFPEEFFNIRARNAKANLSIHRKQIEGRMYWSLLSGYRCDVNCRDQADHKLLLEIGEIADQHFHEERVPVEELERRAHAFLQASREGTVRHKVEPYLSSEDIFQIKSFLSERDLITLSGGSVEGDYRLTTEGAKFAKELEAKATP